jgi:calcineurin-like phosphoesterase family protein
MIDYIYSDPHFGHRKLAEVRGYCEKGCSDKEATNAVAKMNSDLIEHYNSHVCRDQTCLWVGVAFLMSFIEAEKIMQRLNGIK